MEVTFILKVRANNIVFRVILDSEYGVAAVSQSHEIKKTNALVFQRIATLDPKSFIKKSKSSYRILN